MGIDEALRTFRVGRPKTCPELRVRLIESPLNAIRRKAYDTSTNAQIGSTSAYMQGSSCGLVRWNFKGVIRC